MATSVDTLISDTRYRLSDETTESYDSTLLLNAANEAAKIFATTTGCNQAIHNFTSGTGSSIDLSGLTYEWLNVYAVEYAGSALYYAPRSEAAKWSPSADTPAGWNVWADTLYLDKSITMSTANDVDVSYTYVPAAVTATSSNLDIPDRWMPAIKAYMRYVIHSKNRDEGLAASAFAEFESIRNTAAKVNEAQMSGGGHS